MNHDNTQSNGAPVGPRGQGGKSNGSAPSEDGQEHLLPTSPVGHRILLTGGAGFIASRLAELLADDNEVILLDQRFDGTSISYSSAAQHANVRTVVGDIRDVALLKRIVLEVDTIIHLAAMVGVQNVIRNSRDTINVNFLGISNLLSALEGHPGLHRLVYFSTSEVFGANSFRVHENVYSSIGRVNEARWSYSISKLAGEHLVHCYHRDFGLPSVIVRPFNVFGPKRLGDHAMQRFIVNALKGFPLEIHGDGSQIRSWCYVDDFCDCLLRTIVREEAVGEDFNIGNFHNTLTIYELAKRVIHLLWSRSEIRFGAIDYSDIDIRVPRTDKAHRLLGFVPRFELEEAILLSAEWYRAHLELFEAVMSRPAVSGNGYAPQLLPHLGMPAGRMHLPVPHDAGGFIPEVAAGATAPPDRLMP